MPLERGPIRSTAPATPARIRHEGGGQPNRFVYVGITGRRLRERLPALAGGVNADECPFNDPHTAAPHLWLLRRLDGTRLECSCATIAGDMQVLRGTEDMLLWRHRIETGLSTEANYGLFYPGYARPTNRWIARGRWSDARTLGRRAVPLTEHSTPNDFSVSRPALQGPADLLDAHWWQRVPLSDAPSLPIGPPSSASMTTVKGSQSTLGRPPTCQRGPRHTPPRPGPHRSCGLLTCPCRRERLSTCCMSLKATSSAGTSGELVEHLLRSAGDDRGTFRRQGNGWTTHFLAKAPTLDANWRAVVLFGRNVAS